MPYLRKPLGIHGEKWKTDALLDIDAPMSQMARDSKGRWRLRRFMPVEDHKDELRQPAASYPVEDTVQDDTPGDAGY